MKAFIITAGLIIALGSTTVLARDSHHYSGHHYGGDHYSGGYYGHSGRYNRHHGRRYSGHHYSGHRAGEYLVGGLILGSLISHSYYRQRHTYNRDYSYQPRYSSRTRVIRTVDTPVITGRRLFKDIDGNCFERRQDRSGNELLEALPVEECAW